MTVYNIKLIINYKQINSKVIQIKNNLNLNLRRKNKN